MSSLAIFPSEFEKKSIPIYIDLDFFDHIGNLDTLTLLDMYKNLMQSRK